MQVRRCPGCGTEHDPDELFCCGINLSSIDLSVAGAVLPADSPGPESEPRPWSENRVCPDPDCQYENRPDAESCLYCNSPLGPEELSQPESGLPGVAAGPPCPTLIWPWGATGIGDRLPIGRDSGFSPELHSNLAGFGNVSGFHAEIRQRDGCFFLTDLGSKNGTFINERPIPPHVPEILHPGDEIRFAKELKARFVG